jgi:hypothetical protein
MSWYVTIRSDSDYSRAADPRELVAFLRSLPELAQTGANSFREAPGEPWVSVSLAMSDRGSYADPGRPLPSVNLVDVVCSHEHDERWYDALAARIAAFLGWEALDEHAGRVVWPPGGAG